MRHRFLATKNTERISIPDFETFVILEVRFFVRLADEAVSPPVDWVEGQRPRCLALERPGYSRRATFSVFP